MTSDTDSSISVCIIVLKILQIILITLNNEQKCLPLFVSSILLIAYANLKFKEKVEMNNERLSYC